MTRTRTLVLPALAAAAAVAVALAGPDGGLGPSRPANAQSVPPIPVGGRVATDNACYVRLPDMPPTSLGAGRYGGHGAYNPKTGVLAYAGGADKATDENTVVFYQMFGIKLDGERAQWKNIPYGGSVGYTQDTDKGCRELASVQLSDTNSASVFGKDGCDNGAFDSGKAGGDIKELQVGDGASASGIRWVPNSGASELLDDLKDNKGKLVRLFAAWDAQRSRIVFGQGTFNDEIEDQSQEIVYAAKKVGSKYQIGKLRPTGDIPVRRYGSCAAYIHDQAAGVDGVLILGGQEGAPERIPATTYAEVWWLDFSRNANGQWTNISSRFTNLVKDPDNPSAPYLGGRREGACAYDAETKTFYSWMGRASASVPDGASHSTGAWRVNLSQLGDANAKLTWERLAKDNTPGLKGRRLFPSVWDSVNKRMFAIGGRNDLAAMQDVWAIYPDVTGEACANLDPFAPFRPGTVPTATPPVGPGPTSTPGQGPAPTNTPAPPPPTAPEICDNIRERVPAAVLNAALAAPQSVQGWDQLCNPNVAPSLVNVKRNRLTMQDPGKKFHPLFNSLVWRCGCR